MLCKISHFPEPNTRSKNNIKVELDSNYATKSDLKSETDVNISKFTKEVDLAILKLDVDRLDIDKSPKRFKQFER